MKIHHMMIAIFATAAIVIVILVAVSAASGKSSSYLAGVSYVDAHTNESDAYQLKNGCRDISLDPPEEDGYPDISKYDRPEWREGCLAEVNRIYGI
jgi:hypothetical protein